MRPSLSFWALLPFLTSVVGLLLPYNPTSIFLSPTDADLAYIFLPPTASSYQSQLATINISSTLQASNLSPKSLTTNLPFEIGDNANSTTTYLPYISTSGSIGVYAGSCASVSSFWIFSPDGKTSGRSSIDSGNGSWAQMSVEPTASSAITSLTSANFLASAFSFSTYIDSNDTQRSIYAFGGMCPTTTESNTSFWQSSAIYSNNMLKLSPSSTSQTTYELSVTGSVSNRPIAEAGFTITGLAPTYSNSSAGLMPQAQNFVLIGGHTKEAFINMSQVALFSLPQETWSFQGVDTPTVGETKDLAIKSTVAQTPDSRSGHTAILTSDGTAIIVFGGWVGDVNTPADPQLAVLHLGSGFGGSGDWQWEVPTTSGTGLSSGEGIYGHGAVMLPGDVMMVVGGSRISSFESRRLRRADASTQALFFNTTALSWMTEYNNPSYLGAKFTSASASTTNKTGKAKKVGLGAGLGFGIAAIIGALLVYFLYARRLKSRRREARDRDIQDLGQGAAGYSVPGGGMSDQERENWWKGVRGGEMTQTDRLLFGSSASNLGSRSLGAGSNNLGYGPLTYSPNHGSVEYDDGGLVAPVPSVPGRSVSIQRKPVSARNARGYYQPAPSSANNDNWSHTRANSFGTAGPIHPIYEADEEENPTILPEEDEEHGLNVPFEETDDVTLTGQTVLRHPSTTLRHSTTSDPFRDPSPLKENPSSRPGTSNSQYFDRRSPSPETAAEEREREIAEWVADWAAADAIMTSKSRAQSTYSGRLSPTKDSSGRTESNLSEKSLATVSALGLSRNSSVNQRGNTLTTFFGGASGSWNPFSNGTTAVGLGSITEQGFKDDDLVPVSYSSRDKPPPSSGSGTSSFTTAHTTLSFSKIRADGEGLLPRPQELEYIPDGPGSPSKRKALKRGPAGGWFGTLKRVFSGAEGERSAPGSSSSRSSPGRNRSPSLTGTPTRPGYGDLGMGFGAVNDGLEPPKRTVSASATLWRRKQGPEDWEDSADPAERYKRQRSSTMTLDGARTSLDEWDIERAIESRVVQVMFTVPKDKLRVVNADIDGSDTGSIMEKEAAGHEQQIWKERGNVEEPERETDSASLRGKQMILEEPTILERSAPSPTPSRPGSPGKLKGRVQEIVEKMESQSTQM